MVVVTINQGLLSDDFRGKFGEPVFFGGAIFGKSRWGDNEHRAGVYQKQMGAKKKVLSLHRDNFPTNNRTENQQAWRAVFHDGKIAWDALDTETKQEYNSMRYLPGQSGFNRFMSKYLKANY
jgi:hypothetical protein